MMPIAGILGHARRLNREGATMGSRIWRKASVSVCTDSAPPMPKFYIKTYGCQMNERDSEQVAHSLVARGYQPVANEEEADVVLLNTCSVRDMADQKALGKMGMLGRAREAPAGSRFRISRLHGAGARRVACSKVCRISTSSSARKNFIASRITSTSCCEKKAARGAWTICASRSATSRKKPARRTTIREQQLAPRQATAFVSIMQGCNMHCTFCIVPRTRGAERSRTIEEIVREVRDSSRAASRKSHLLGQIVNLYGRHEFPKRDGKSPFVQLLEAVHAIDGLERIRFTSPHPIGFRDDLIYSLGNLPKLVEHVHLPLQSGSDRILKAMHRPYTAEKYRAFWSSGSARPNRKSLSRPM